MSNENLDSWKTNTAVIIETVRVAKDYLDGELGKYESWEKLPQSLINLLTSLYFAFRMLEIIITKQ